VETPGAVVSLNDAVIRPPERTLACSIVASAPANQNPPLRQQQLQLAWSKRDPLDASAIAEALSDSLRDSVMDPARESLMDSVASAAMLVVASAQESARAAQRTSPLVFTGNPFDPSRA
jgi:hypothetical protein